MLYDFDEVIERKNTQSSKWDNVGPRTGNADALPMWVADADFRCPQPVVEAIRKRAEHPVYGYPYVTPEFYDVTERWMKRRYGWKIEEQWVVFATGIVPVINAAVQEFAEPGDEVIVQEPVYHQFRAPILDNGRTISNNALIYENGRYVMDFGDLEKRAASPRAKLMILCSPHNPVGRVWSANELSRVAEICLKNEVVLVSDEIHSDLTLFGNRHVPTAGIDARYAGNTVTCIAPSKTFNIAGLRGSGVIVPNEEVRKRLESRFKKNRGIQQNIFALPAYIAAYTECDDYLEQLIPYIEGNVAFLDGFLKENMPAIKLVHPEATYLMWLDCTELGLSGDALADFFVSRCRVAVSRGDQFGQSGTNFARLNIACPRKTLKTALERIREQYSALSKKEPREAARRS